MVPNKGCRRRRRIRSDLSFGSNDGNDDVGGRQRIKKEIRNLRKKGKKWEEKKIKKDKIVN
ncbi:hypothetical protein SLEP1_g33373 [Rubroshorea leprosula]|uniref:Uncharacterized protein n=1 Tax=Rubroshorea leprosula TaxID=152421 RepID=A0AAV5KGL4_9ROSI|nr:hypothetical protein SLEP1_g33373 [Rubroshorea leprosula]